MASLALLQTVSSSSSQSQDSRLPPPSFSPISFNFSYMDSISSLDQQKENEMLRKLKGFWNKVHKKQCCPPEGEDDFHFETHSQIDEISPPPDREKEKTEGTGIYPTVSKRNPRLEEDKELSKSLIKSSSGPSFVSHLFNSESQLLESIEAAHDGWLALGLDTRKALREKGASGLPPHFMHPPRYGAEEMNRRLREMMGCFERS